MKHAAHEIGLLVYSDPAIKKFVEDGADLCKGCAETHFGQEVSSILILVIVELGGIRTDRMCIVQVDTEGLLWLHSDESLHPEYEVLLKLEEAPGQIFDKLRRYIDIHDGIAWIVIEYRSDTWSHHDCQVGEILIQEGERRSDLSRMHMSTKQDDDTVLEPLYNLQERVH